MGGGGQFLGGLAAQPDRTDISTTNTEAVQLRLIAVEDGLGAFPVGTFGREFGLETDNLRFQIISHSLTDFVHAPGSAAGDQRGDDGMR